MRTEEAKEYFDQILDAPEGAKLEIPCESLSDADSARTLFYRQRKAYIAAVGSGGKYIGVQRMTYGDIIAEEKGFKYSVILHVTKQRKPALLTLTDGTTKEVVPTFAPAVNDEGLTPDQQRMYDLMLQDGYSMEEALTIVKEG